MVCCIKQLLEDPTSYVHGFVVAPGKMLSGRGNLLVYLNNMIFRVTEGKLTPHILTHCMLLFLVIFLEVLCCNASVLI